MKLPILQRVDVPVFVFSQKIHQPALRNTGSVPHMFSVSIRNSDRRGDAVQIRKWHRWRRETVD